MSRRGRDLHRIGYACAILLHSLLPLHCSYLGGPALSESPIGGSLLLFIEFLPPTGGCGVPLDVRIVHSYAAFNII